MDEWKPTVRVDRGRSKLYRRARKRDRYFAGELTFFHFARAQSRHRVLRVDTAVAFDFCDNRVKIFEAQSNIIGRQLLLRYPRPEKSRTFDREALSIYARRIPPDANAIAEFAERATQIVVKLMMRDRAVTSCDISSRRDIASICLRGGGGEGEL